MPGARTPPPIAFKALTERPDARFLGLRGLLRQAMQREDWAAAQRLAKEAEAAQPGAAWLREERQVLALRMRDWREALALAAPDGPRAALALAASLQEEDPARAAGVREAGLRAPMPASRLARWRMRSAWGMPAVGAVRAACWSNPGWRRRIPISAPPGWPARRIAWRA